MRITRPFLDCTPITAPARQSRNVASPLTILPPHGTRSGHLILGRVGLSAQPIFVPGNVRHLTAAHAHRDDHRVDQTCNSYGAEAKTQAHYILVWHAQESSQCQNSSEMHNCRCDIGAQAARTHRPGIRSQGDDDEGEAGESGCRRAGYDVKVAPIRKCCHSRHRGTTLPSYTTPIIQSLSRVNSQVPVQPRVSGSLLRRYIYPGAVARP